MNDPAPRPAPSPPPAPLAPTLYPASFEDFANRQFNRSLPGEEVEDYKTFSWRVSWHEQQAAAIRSPRFEVGGQHWTMSIRPNRELETGIVSIVLNHESPELLQDGHVCARIMISMSSPADLALKKSYLDQGAYRFAPERRVYGFPDFANRDNLVKRCVDAEGDSIVTVFLKVLRDPTGYLMYPFHSSAYDSRKVTGQVTLRDVADLTDVGLLPLFYIPDIREMVYDSRACPNDSRYTRALLDALPKELLSKQSARGDTLALTHDILKTLDDSHDDALTDFLRLLWPRCVFTDEEKFGSQKVLAVANFVLEEESAEDVQEAIDMYFVRDPQPSRDPPTDGPRTSLFDLPPTISFNIRSPVPAGTDAPRITFPLKLDMNPYLPSNYAAFAQAGLNFPPRTSRRSNTFRLHAIICQLPDQSIASRSRRVQKSSYAFIKPEPDGPWFRHRHERVVPVTEKEALETGFGGRGVAGTKKYGAAVSLVYVDEEHERLNKGRKKPRAQSATRNWVKANIRLKEGEREDPFTFQENVLHAAVTGIVLVAAVFAIRATMRWRR